jgi:hypothetical protein
MNRMLPHGPGGGVPGSGGPTPRCVFDAQGQAGDVPLTPPAGRA